MTPCAPSTLLSGIHHRLPHLSHVRFGGNFTDDSLRRTLPGEIVHSGGWAGILLTASFLVLGCVYVCSFCLCLRYKKGKCTRVPQNFLRLTSGFLTILSALGVVLAFWPEIVMHNGINSSADDIQQNLPEIAGHVVERALLSTEQRRHSLFIGYLVALLLFMTVTIFVIFFAKMCECGAGIFIFVVILAVVTTTVHVPLLVFLFVMIVMYADVCTSIYSLDGGTFCEDIIQNATSSVDPGVDTLNVFCNKTVYSLVPRPLPAFQCFMQKTLKRLGEPAWRRGYLREHGFILIMIGIALASLFVLIQLAGFSYGSYMCCQHSKSTDKNIEMEGGSFVSSDAPSVVDTFRQVPWASQQDMVELKRVLPGSAEWTDIQRQLQATLQTGSISSIERIQNKWLWESYVQSRHRLSKKNKNVINERLLFHGTSETPPEKIYKSEKGFDFRFANKGLWGEGSYFAVNASYSDTYAYKVGETKQMFLALVLTGASYHGEQDRSLKQPPKKPDSKMFTDERFDSVSGTTSGSEIYVIYDHDKAYPAYIITYTR